MRTLIAGASGAIGRALVRRLRATQHEVFALTQSGDSAPALKETGAEPVIADALDAAAVKAAVGRIRPDAVINELTSLPRHYTPAEMKAAAERDRKVRVEGNMKAPWKEERYSDQETDAMQRMRSESARRRRGRKEIT